MGSGQPHDHPLPFEALQVIGGLPAGVGDLELGGDESDQSGIVEAGEQVGEPDEGSPHHHHAEISESQFRAVLGIDGGRPGHLGKGGHVWSGTVIAADAEVAGVADHRPGTQRPMLLEVLLDPAGLVVAADLRSTRSVTTPRGCRTSNWRDASS